MATLLRCSPGVGSIYIIQLAMKSVNARALGSHLLPFPCDRGTQCRVVCVTYLLIPFSPEVHFRGFVCCEIGRRHPQCPEPLWSGDCADGGWGGFSALPTLSQACAEVLVLQTPAPAHLLKGAWLSLLQFQCSFTGEMGGWSESVQSFSFWTSPSSEPTAGFRALHSIMAPRTSLAAQPPHPTPITVTFSPLTHSV